MQNPQTIPVTEAESAFDLAVLKEMLRLEPENFYSPNLKKIYIPEAFVKIFPNLTKLAFLLIDALKPVCLTSFILKSENLGVRNLGTFIKPEKITPDGYVDIYISTNKFRVLSGNISIIPCSSPKFDLKLESNLEIIPGKTLEESREIKILQVLNEVRTKIGTIVKEKFPKENPISSMIKAGGGGNILNITQMACCVGQQALWGKRIDFGFTQRTLSFFNKGDLSPKARGFIRSSFIKGLRPDEFFFGAIAGRDSLMDTALRTPKSGYLYRRLANAFQDLREEYDGTVRDSGDNIIEFKYGDDNKEVSELHTGGNVCPGEALGLVTAQSFGEPSTQMALNVFHFAGVAEMQVTMGLPRLIEIFDTRKKPSSPKMEIYLTKEYNNEKDAEVFAEKIKEVTLKEIASEIGINFSKKIIEIKIDKEALRKTHASAKKIVERLNDLDFKAKEKDDIILLDSNALSFKEIYQLKEKLKNTIISGVKGIKQILIFITNSFLVHTNCSVKSA